MYIESQKDELPFADLIRAAEEKTCESKSFPYKYHVCRCRNCAYCYQGKCALKHCCCMRDRVKARSCTFSEVLGDCFAMSYADIYLDGLIIDEYIYFSTAYNMFSIA